MAMNRNTLKSFLKKQLEVLEAMDELVDDAVAAGMEESDFEKLFTHCDLIQDATEIALKAIETIESSEKNTEKPKKADEEKPESSTEEEESEEDIDLGFCD